MPAQLESALSLPDKGGFMKEAGRRGVENKHRGGWQVGTDNSVGSQRETSSTGVGFAIALS